MSTDRCPLRLTEFGSRQWWFLISVRVLGELRERCEKPQLYAHDLCNSGLPKFVWGVSKKVRILSSEKSSRRGKVIHSDLLSHPSRIRRFEVWHKCELINYSVIKFSFRPGFRSFSYKRQCSEKPKIGWTRSRPGERRKSSERGVSGAHRSQFCEFFGLSLLAVPTELLTFALIFALPLRGVLLKENDPLL